jgi:hypothetical protein
MGVHFSESGYQVSGSQDAASAVPLSAELHGPVDVPINTRKDLLVNMAGHQTMVLHQFSRVQGIVQRNLV